MSSTSSSSYNDIDKLAADHEILTQKFKELNLNKSQFEIVLKELDDDDKDKSLLERVSTGGRQRSSSTRAGEKQIDLNQTLRRASLLNVSDDSEVWKRGFDFLNMATLEDLVRQLTQLQVERNTTKPGDVIKTVSNIIIRFDKFNIGNFLDSVELALSVVGEEQSGIVLKYAQQRVVGSVSIESKTYETFASFKSDVLAAFKPKRTVTEIESLIARLTQDHKESVDAYSKRVFQLKTEYENASRSERAVANATLDEIRIGEMERKVSNAFINGLKDHVIKFVISRPQSLSEAVGVALEAESTSSLRFQNRKGQVSKDDSDKKKVSHFQKKSQSKSPHGKEKYSSRDGGKPKGPPKCYICGSENHLKPDCPKLHEEAGTQAKALVAKNKKENPKNLKDCGASVSAKSLKVKTRR